MSVWSLSDPDSETWDAVSRVFEGTVGLTGLLGGTNVVTKVFGGAVGLTGPLGLLCCTMR